MLLVKKKSKARVYTINIGPTDEGITVRCIVQETIAHLAPHILGCPDSIARLATHLGFAWGHKPLDS
jgi:hypothetical protein